LIVSSAINRRTGVRVLKHDVPVTALVLSILVGTACTRAPAGLKFASPEAAATTLLQALKNNDTAKLEALFGREAVQEGASGDPTSDRNDRELIALAMEQSWRWSSLGPDRLELIIGDEQWPCPAPLVKTGSEWRFDGEAAKEEILARRIGRNELTVISICRAYVGMQREYASEAHDGKPAGLFAQRLRSTDGRHDGLYWPKTPGKKHSPLGDLAAEAAEDGYAENRPPSSPLWGYHFRVLTGQGDAAPGGRRSYIVNGNMSGGFGLVAFPTKYGSSGVMTFEVNRDGVVYEKDLGSETATLAPRITDYNPDASWSEVRVR
jgi:Protein of unknown function (DUF2950)